MIRELRFDGPKAQSRFEILYGAIIIGGSSQGTPRGSIEVLRREARILDLLDEVSVENPDESVKFHTERGRNVNADALVLMDQPDFDLLKERIEKTPWIPAAARKVVDTLDWLSAAPQLEKEKQA